MIRSDFLFRAALALVLTYMLAIGATFNGILTPDFKQPTLALMAVGVGVWLLARWRKAWIWHRTPLDGVMLLWIAAFAVSLVANLEVWRRVVIGLWYISSYIGLWYVLHDAVANRGLRRETVSGALLIAGFIVLLFGYLQIPGWLNTRLPLMTEGVIPFDLPRPVSTIGNTNALACFLVVLIPFIMSSVPAGRNRFERIVLSVYALLAIFLLFLTYSRGAWMGFVAAVGVWVGLQLSAQGMLSVSQLRRWWSGLARKNRAAVLSLCLILFIIACVATLFVVESFSQAGRSVERRTILFEPAVKLYAERPLTGYGLFTFGRGYMRLESLPPNQPHSHAHNVPLLIASELGLVGIFALLGTVGVMFWSARCNWGAASVRERRGISGAVAAVVGFGTHHLIDTPAMMPAVALTGLVALVLALTPIEPLPIAVKWRRLGQSVVLAGLWLVLLGTGLWSSGVYSRYVAILREVGNTNDYRAAADALQSVIETDPAMAIYLQQQAFLYGMAADSGDMESAGKGIQAYQHFLTLEPYHAPSWANVAALYWQTDQPADAIAAMEKAVELAPESWQLAFNLATYYEEVGRSDHARDIYERIWSPCNQYPEWQATELRREVSEGRAGTCLKEGIDFAGYMNRAFAAARRGNREEALTLFQQVERFSAGAPENRAWVHLSRAGIAELNGDIAAVDAEFLAAASVMGRDLDKEDFGFGINIAHFQYLRQALARQFLPQVYYPNVEPALYAWIVSD